MVWVFFFFTLGFVAGRHFKNGKNERNHFVGHNIPSYFMLKVLVPCTSMPMTMENAGLDKNIRNDGTA